MRVITACSPVELEQCMAIRYKVFIEEQGYPPSIEIEDPQDAHSTHFLLLDGNTPAGAVRLNNQNSQLGRFAILPEYRGKGLAKILLDALCAHVQSAKGSFIRAEVQADPRPGKVDARGVYLRYGFQPVGELYMKLDMLHQDMIINL